MSKTTVKNLEAVRSEMRRVGVDAVIIPGTDPHQSEYINEYWKVRRLGEWIHRQQWYCSDYTRPSSPLDRFSLFPSS